MQVILPPVLKVGLSTPLPKDLASKMKLVARKHQVSRQKLIGAAVYQFLNCSSEEQYNLLFKYDKYEYELLGGHFNDR